MSTLNQRTLDIFRHVVNAFFETGEPIGSKTISQKLENQLSSATIRNIMAQLESLGYLYSPHTSAGRLPTDQGLRFFVNGLLEQGNVSLDEKTVSTELVKSGVLMREMFYRKPVRSYPAFHLARVLSWPQNNSTHQTH